MRALVSTIEQRLDVPTARGLAQAVSRAIRDGELTSGQRLPPIRTVAKELMLSPTTVSAAWQLLARSGAIRSDGRRGTTVAQLGAHGGERYARALSHTSEVSLDLSTGIPDAELLPDLTTALASLDASATPGSYLDDPVLPELRAALLAEWPYAADDLLVVDGAMDAHDLIVRSHLRTGDVAVVEDPGFPPLLDLLEARDIEVVGVAMDESGMSVDGLEQALARRPSVVFLQPRGQNPTGISMTPTRARRLSRVVAASGSFVVEDDSAGDVAASQALSLGSWLPDQVLHVRSFSKSYGPDLRIAAVSGPEDLLAPVRRTRALGQGWTSRLLQRVLATLLADHVAAGQVEHARGEYARRRELVTRRLAERDVHVPGTDGLNIWVPVRDESAAVLRLASQGVAVTPGSPFHVDSQRGPAGHIRVTTGLLRRDHEAVADLIADAALVGAWTAQHR